MEYPQSSMEVTWLHLIRAGDQDSWSLYTLEDIVQQYEWRLYLGISQGTLKETGLLGSRWYLELNQALILGRSLLRCLIP